MRRDRWLKLGKIWLLHSSDMGGLLVRRFSKREAVFMIECYRKVLTRGNTEDLILSLRLCRWNRHQPIVELQEPHLCGDADVRGPPSPPTLEEGIRRLPYPTDGLFLETSALPT